MRPDLIRLYVDKRPKTYIVDANQIEKSEPPMSTLERVGLKKPLPKEDEEDNGNGYIKVE